ncbi:MAG: Stk1 family PASTA domain-containing Ser/Thr kinase [Oscillospiraceae bacterium]|nr:Stk1 family PASTA domain-containing Ser/Thr kinase [Oscillospiraceae bacterium]
MDKYIGRLLDNRYEILEVIGTGGMAVVYKARCHRLNRLVAIKILKDDFLEDEEFRARFHSESQAVAMLSHSNIVSVYDVSTSITADYIVMELIDGITLKQYMEKKGVLNWKETLHFAIQIAKALEHAHEKGIVHRDIKPHNVMVLKNGSVKVTDFGIARMMSKSNTLTKEALGSVHYISPEQAKGGRVDNRSDIYSLGVVLYEMMSGRPPYDGDSPVSVAIKHINGGAALPSSFNPNIPGGLEQIIMKAMAHDPADRYETATKMLADLDEFRKDPGILFDYHLPVTEEIPPVPQNTPLVLETEPKTTAERVQNRETPSRRTSAHRPRQPQRRQDPQQRRRQSEEDRKSSNVATIAIVACSLVMVVAIVIFLIVLLSSGVSTAPNLVQVPDLLGKEYAVVSQYSDFGIQLDKEVHDNEYPAGQIIDQKPAAGEEIEKGKNIYVTVSLGPAPKVVSMPDVAGWELTEAERALNNLSMNLRLDIRPTYSETVAADAVIKTEPVAETELTVGQNVVLYVSMGSEIKTSTMPELVEKTEEAAKSVLNAQELDLEIEVVEEFNSQIEKGAVIRTEPEAGGGLQTGQKVVLYISKGPELKKVQNVTGFTVNSAVEILKGDGFINYEIEPVESDEKQDTVVEQSVTAGTEIDVNTKIVLKVSKGKLAKEKTVTIQIPTSEDLGEMGLTEDDYTNADGTVSFAMELRQGSVVCHTRENLNFSSSAYQVNLTGTGKQVYVLYVDGREYIEIPVDFDA